MNSGIGFRKAPVALTTLALLCGTVGVAPRAEAAIALDIVNAFDGTKLGSIALPAATGTSSSGVTFSLAGFTQGDITSLTWDFDPQTAGGDSLSLSAFTGDSPCSPADGPCTNATLSLDLEGFSVLEHSCPPPPPPGEDAVCTGLGLFNPVEFIEAAPAYACVGFEPPLAGGPVTVKGNRALPLKAELVDQDDVPLTDADLGAAPVVQINYHSGIGETPEDVSDLALWAGQGSPGNAFVFSDDRWRFNLKVGNYTAPGTYVISMASGDGAEYRVDPTCEAEFVVNP